MTLKGINYLSECPYGRHFLSKSYSIELLLYLLEHQSAEGIEDLLGQLKSTTPKLPAFLSFISLLEAKGCLKKIENKSNRSKRKIMLTDECESAVRQYFTYCGTDFTLNIDANSD